MNKEANFTSDAKEPSDMNKEAKISKQKGFFTSDAKEPWHQGNVLAKVVIWLLLASFFERAAYYWSTASMVPYLRSRLGLGAVIANNMQATFQAIVYIVPIIAAYLVDTYLGRFIVIPVSALACVVAMILLTIGEGTDTHWLIYIALFFMLPFFDATIKANLMVLGGDQFRLTEEAQLKQYHHMFQLYYWFTNVAAAIAFFVAPEIASEGMGSVSVKNGYLVTYIVALGMFGICTSIFVVFGLFLKKWYIKGPEGSVVPSFFKTSLAAAKLSKRGKLMITSFLTLMLVVLLSIPNFFVPGQAQVVLNYTIGAFIVLCMIGLICFGTDNSWVKKASNIDGITESMVDNAASVWALMPYLAFGIPFWACYNQMNTNLINQACQTNNYYGDISASARSFAAPSLSALNAVVIVVLIPLFDYGLFPLMEKCGIKDTLLRRMGLGILAAGLSLISCALLEYRRRNADLIIVPCGQEEMNWGWCNPLASDAFSNGWNHQVGMNDIESYYRALDAGIYAAGDIMPVPPLSTSDNPLAYVITKCAGKADEGTFGPFQPIKDVSIWLWVIPMGLTGLAEILYAAVTTDFMYSQVPADVRAIMQALNMLTVSMGTLVGGIIDVMMSSYLTTNLDRGHIEWVYWTVLGLNICCLLVFMLKSRKFEYRVETLPKTTTDTSLIDLEESTSNSDSSLSEEISNPKHSSAAADN